MYRSTGKPDWGDGIVLVAVSPHLDDAVLSIAALLSQAAREGALVKVVTVFAGDPASAERAGTFDAMCGFRTQGEAAGARRAEDREACARIGATPLWLEHADSQYTQTRDGTLIWEEVAASCAEADTVLVPGYPLAHPDHAYLAELLLRRGAPAPRLGLYVEQPYALQRSSSTGAPMPVPALLREFISTVPTYESVSAGIRDRVAKWRAVGEYRSQLPLHRAIPGVRRTVSLRYRVPLLRAGEAVAWLAADPRDLRL